MTKEELIKLSRENLRKSKQGLLCECYDEAFIKGYELSKKRIAELIALINAERERQEKCDDVHLRTIAELEKENAELKKQLEMSNKVYNDNLDYSHHIEDQLTKAKEYIKLLLMNCVGVYESTGKTIAEIQAEAEQFLKENA